METTLERPWVRCATRRHGAERLRNMHLVRRSCCSTALRAIWRDTSSPRDSHGHGLSISAEPVNSHPKSCCFRYVSCSFHRVEKQHDGPRFRQPGAALLRQHPESALGLQHLAALRRCCPPSACTDLAIRLLLRATNGYLAGNLAFALSHVRTPFVIKVEHDHPFVRPIDLISVVRDMSADKRLKYDRFNRRSNVQKNCDNGDYPRSLLGTEDERIARLWGPL